MEKEFTKNEIVNEILEKCYKTIDGFTFKFQNDNGVYQFVSNKLTFRFWNISGTINNNTAYDRKFSIGNIIEGDIFFLKNNFEGIISSSLEIGKIVKEKEKIQIEESKKENIQYIDGFEIHIFERN